MSNNTNNFFFFNNSKDEGNGCLGALGLLVFFLCTPGLLLAVIVNWIVPVNILGLLFLVLLGSAAGFVCMAAVGGANNAKDAGSVTMLYFVLCFVLGIALFASGSLSHLLGQSMGSEPYTSLITSQIGQAIFWISMVALGIGLLTFYFWLKEDENNPVKHAGYTTACKKENFGLTEKRADEIHFDAIRSFFDVAKYNSYKTKGEKAYFVQQYVRLNLGFEETDYSRLVFTWEEKDEYRSILVYHQLKGIEGDKGVRLHIKRCERMYYYLGSWVEGDDQDVSFSMLGFCQLKLKFPRDTFIMIPLVKGNTTLKDGQKCMIIDYSPKALNKARDFYSAYTDRLVAQWSKE